MMRKMLLGALALVVLAGLIVPPLFGPRRSALYLSPMSEAPPYTFPEGFLWGTATSSHQIESSQPNDWSAFEEQVMKERRFGSFAAGGVLQAAPGHIRGLGDFPEEVRRKKTNHDALMAEDVALMASLGVGAYRFSIEWSRLFPSEEHKEPDAAGVAFYRGLLDALRKAKITPFVTLFHFTTPAWLFHEREGLRGFERADALAHFERFVRAVLLHYGADISHYCTLNEPMVYIYNGYLQGIFPPLEQRGDPSKVAPLMAQLLRAHALAYRLIKEDGRRRGREVAVGYTQHARAFEPYRNYAPLDRLSARMIEQAFIWDFADAVKTGTLRVTNTSFREEIPGLAGAQDYLGINYYGRFYVKTDLLHPTRFEILMHDPRTDGARTSGLGWASYPRGFAEILRKARERYGLPLYVLENGIADDRDDDTARQRYLLEHVREMWHAMRHHGADVRGYFYWSLLDNFEWAEGFGPRFGLFRVDYLKGFRRVPRGSADLYRRVIAAGGLPEELAEMIAVKE